MSSVQLMFKLFRHNLKATGAYLFTLMLAVAMYYDFTILKYSPEMLGSPSLGTTVLVCVLLMSIVMAVVMAAFVWSSSRFFLMQRRKEIGLYALCGVPIKRVGRVFLWDALLTGVCALMGGLLLGMVLTKLFLMGAALMIQVEKPMTFILPLPAVLETGILTVAMFTAVALRNTWIVRRSRLIDLLQGMRAAETPPKRRVLLAVLAVLSLAAGYAMSVWAVSPSHMEMIVFLCIPILVLVILGSYWAFQALLPGVLSRLAANKDLFYRGMRMVGISNLWYRLRSNYRNLALTSVLSATAIVTLCTALTMSDYVGAREGKQAQRLVRSYSFTAWMDPEETRWMQEQLDEQGIEASCAFWIPVVRVDAGERLPSVMVLESSQIRQVAARLMFALNLPVPEIQVPDGQAVVVSNPNSLRMDRKEGTELDAQIGEQVLPATANDELWLWGGSSYLYEACIVPDGYLALLTEETQTTRMFLGLQIPDEQARVLVQAVAQSGRAITAEQNKQLTTGARLLFGTLGYLGLIMFGVFSLLTGCALLFKQLSEAAADRLKYQAMIHIGATRAELRQAVGWQVGLSLLIPMLLGFVHALFAVRVMGALFNLPTMAYLLISLGVYGALVLVLYIFTVHRFLRIVT